MSYSQSTPPNAEFRLVWRRQFVNNRDDFNQGLSVFLMSLRAQRGNLVAVAMMVPRHVLNLNEIATSLRSSQ